MLKFYFSICIIFKVVLFNYKNRYYLYFLPESIYLSLILWETFLFQNEYFMLNKLENETEQNHHYSKIQAKIIREWKREEGNLD